MALPTLKKFCPFCSQPYPLTETACIACGGVLMRVPASEVPEEERVREAKRSLLCCPAVGCPELQVQHMRVKPAGQAARVPKCFDCKTALEVPSIYLWLDKVGSPTRKDLVGFVKNSGELSKRAATATGLGLKAEDALSLLHQAIEEMAGVTFYVLEWWAQVNVAPLAQSGNVTEQTRADALQRAQALGIEARLAGKMFDELAPAYAAAPRIAPPGDDPSGTREAQPDRRPKNAGASAVTPLTNRPPSGGGDSKLGVITAREESPEDAGPPLEGTAEQVGRVTWRIEAGTPMWQSFQYAASYISLWEYVKKPLGWLTFRPRVFVQRWRTDEDLLQKAPWKRWGLLLGFLSSAIAVVGFVITAVALVKPIDSWRRYQNEAPILTEIKCAQTEFKAGEKITLWADYDDEERKHGMRFPWKIEPSGAVTGVDDKPEIELNTSSLMDSTHIVELKITLAVIDKYGKKSNELERKIRVVPPKVSNQQPVVRGFTVNPSIVPSGQKVLLSLSVRDPENQSLVYSWSKRNVNGSLTPMGDGEHAVLDTTGMNPTASNNVEVYVDVTISDNVTIPISITEKIIVTPAAENVARPDPQSPAHATPAIIPVKLLKCQPSTDTVRRLGETVRLSALASDLANDDLHYKWTPDAGRVEPQYGENVTLYTDGIDPSTKTIRVKMEVFNKRGVGVSHNIYINVELPPRPPPPSTEPTPRPAPTPEVKHEAKPKADGGEAEGAKPAVARGRSAPAPRTLKVSAPTLHPPSRGRAARLRGGASPGRA